jgi:lipopolysaccharide transport system permease protein
VDEDMNSVRRLLDPAPYLRAFSELASLIVRRRVLTYEMAKREVSAEHSGKALGMSWGVVQPLFLLAIYALVYGIVFRAKIGGTYELPRNFTIYLLSGLVPWFAFQFAMVKGAGAITTNAALVRQVIFDLDIVPIATALAACLSLFVGIVFVGAYTAVAYNHVPWTYALLPVVFLMQFLAMCGVAFVLSALGVFLRDIRDIVQLSAIVLIFLMPIVYLPKQVPAAFSLLLWFNPFTYMVYCYQDVLYFGRINHPLSWLVFLLWSLLAYTGGYRLFRRVKPYFGNVL